MFFGIAGRSSVTHTAACRASGRSCEPNALVVLVKTKLSTPAASAVSSRLSVPVTLVSTKALLAVGRHMRLVQGRGVDDGGDAVHLAPNKAGIDDRAHSIGEGRCLQIDHARRRAAASERPQNGLPEMAGAACDQNCHGGFRRRSGELMGFRVGWFNLETRPDLAKG